MGSNIICLHTITSHFCELRALQCTCVVRLSALFLSLSRCVYIKKERDGEGEKGGGSIIKISYSTIVDEKQFLSTDLRQIRLANVKTGAQQH